MSFDPLRIRLQGVHSIEASAGTGKTYTITTLYVRHIVESELSVEQILVTTYTEAATAELKQRLRDRLSDAFELVRGCQDEQSAAALAERGDADAVLVALLRQAGAWAKRASFVRRQLETALLNFDRAAVFTIHGFCKRTLQELVFETTSLFDAELTTSLDDLIEEVVADFASRWWAREDSSIARWLDLKEDLWNHLRSVASSAVDNPLCEIEPDDRSLESLLDASEFDAFDDAAREFQTSWQAGKDSALALVEHARVQDWLHKNSYGSDKQIASAASFLDRVAADPLPDHFDFSKGTLNATHRRLSQSELIAKTKKAHQGKTPKHDVFQKVDQLVERATRIEQIRQQVRPTLVARLAAKAGPEVARRKSLGGLMSFSDLLHEVDQALAGSQGDLLLRALRRRYRVALVDEFQDTDPVQYRIFHRVFQQAAEPAAKGQGSDGKDRSFVMIGDPKQSIYRFRGADIHSYLAATRETPPKQRYEMGVNWRSDRSLVAAVQGVFASSSDPFLHAEIGLPHVDAQFDDRMDGEPALQFSLVPRHEQVDEKRHQGQDLALRQVVQFCVRDVVRQLNNPPQIPDPETKDLRRLRPGDVAILCRTSKQLRSLQKELAARGVPAVLHVDESVFSTPEAEDAARVLQALANPGELTLLRNALVTSLFALSANQMHQLQTDEAELSRWGTQFYQWNRVWRDQGFFVVWRRIMQEQQVAPRLAASIGGERRITNLLHLGELLHQQAATAHAGPEQLIRWLERQMSDVGQRDEASQLRLETDSAAVQLCTIHKSKGLEYPVVYCPTLWHVYGGGDPNFVVLRIDDDLKVRDRPLIDVGSSRFADRLDQAKAEELAEDRRLLYVALTRAKHQCNIHWTETKDGGKSALGNLMYQGASPGKSDEQIKSLVSKWKSSMNAESVVVRGSDVVQQAEDPGRYQPPAAADVVLSCREVRRPNVRSLRQTSYSALSRDIEQAPEIETADRDQVDRDATSIDALPEAGDASQSSPLVPLAGMPGGRHVGDLVHMVFERLLLEPTTYRAAVEPLRESARQVLQSEWYRADLEESWLEPLTEAVVQCLSGPIQLTDSETSLKQIPPQELSCEMPFVLRIAGRSGDADLSRIADALGRSSTELVRGYAPRMNFQQNRMRGFLSGFIDLVFRWQDRWYLLDYKTNRLGVTRSDYAAARLEEEMVHHDYILQYHLYTVALDRFLRSRIPDYNYDSHFGGCVYQFIRGFDAQSSSHGLYFDRPSKAVVDALAETLDEEE